jgi:hypothetical protein
MGAPPCGRALNRRAEVGLDRGQGSAGVADPCADVPLPESGAGPGVGRNRHHQFVKPEGGALERFSHLQAGQAHTPATCPVATS